jgi:hypothetical protein
MLADIGDTTMTGADVALPTRTRNRRLTHSRHHQVKPARAGGRDRFRSLEEMP